MPTLTERVNTTVAKLEADAQIQHDVSNGAAGETVTTEGGQVRTVANAIATLMATVARGAWLTTTAYAVRDLVTQSNVVYICVVAHTAGTFATDLAAGKWAVFSGPADEGSLTSGFGRQRRRGTSAEHAAFTGLVGELTVNTSRKTAVVHDGLTAGGTPLARSDLLGIDVLDYGADNTGATDSTTAIQAAITQAMSIKHGRVYLPPGAYKITESLNLGAGGVSGSQPMPIKVHGAGMSTQIINAASTGKPTFLFAGVSYWTLADMLLTGNSAKPNDGVKTDYNGNGQHCIGWTMENVACKMAGRGFVLRNTNTGVLRNCSSWDSGNTYLQVAQTITTSDISHGVHMTGDFCNNITIDGGKFQPSSTFAAGMCGILCDATEAYVIKIGNGTLVEGSVGDSARYGIKLTGSGIQGISLDVIYADNANIYINGCRDGMICNVRNGGGQPLTMISCSRWTLANVTYPTLALTTPTSVVIDACQFFTSLTGVTAEVLVRGGTMVDGVRYPDVGQNKIILAASSVGPQSVPNGVATVLTPTASINQLSWYDAGTGRWTPSVAGDYRMTALVNATMAPGKTWALALYENGTRMGSGAGGGTVGGGAGDHIMYVKPFTATAGNYYELKFTQNDTVTRDTIVDLNFEAL